MQRGEFGCRKQRDKIGVLVGQLGTPDAPTKEALYPYLKQFLSDPRVVEENRLVWWFILRGIVLRRRPARSAALYKRIWTEEGSPLLSFTRRQSEALATRLQAMEPNIEVTFGMRYGSPSLENGIDTLIERGCTRILLFPMYPQYSASTTGSTYDAVFAHLTKKRFIPTLRVVEPYYAHPQYIKAQAQIVNESMAALPSPPDRLLFSYHGVPMSYVQKGDPYCCMCTETTQALLPMLDFPKAQVVQTYQSRFGKAPWLQPYTDETIEQLAKSGVKSLAVSCPGFIADCLETIDEIGTEAKELFEAHGGHELHLLPCLNDHPAWIDAMVEIAVEELGSWLTTVRRNCAIDCAIECPAGIPATLSVVRKA